MCCQCCLVMDLIDILIVNEFMIQNKVETALTHHRVRWDLVLGLVSKSDNLDERDTNPPPEMQQRRSRRQRGLGVRENTNTNDDSSVEEVPRFQGVNKHHHDRLSQYVTREQAVINENIVKENPSMIR